MWSIGALVYKMPTILLGRPQIVLVHRCNHINLTKKIENLICVPTFLFVYLHIHKKSTYHCFEEKTLTRKLKFSINLKNQTEKELCTYDYKYPSLLWREIIEKKKENPASIRREKNRKNDDEILDFHKFYADNIELSKFYTSVCCAW